jgi:FlaA1/EpsC-like NDP-sugar epimerase
MLDRYVDWSGAVTVLVITTVLVVLDVADGAVHRYWSRHSFTSSVLAGVLVVALTVLIVDRVTRRRQLKNQSRVIAVQAAVIVAQATRTADAIARSAQSAEDREGASDELRTYTQVLLTSAPVLIESKVPLAVLEAGQRAAGQMFRAMRDAEEGADPAKEHVDAAVQELRQAAAPLLNVLNLQQREAVSSDGDEQPEPD